MDIVILAAGKPHRGSTPTLLQSFDDDQLIFDWILRLFDGYSSSIRIVGGYKAEEVTKKHPNLDYIVNYSWKNTGNLYSLFLAPMSGNKPLCILYGDVVFSKDACQKFFSEDGADIYIAVDKKWKKRYPGRHKSDITVAEKVILGGEAIYCIDKSIDSNSADAEFCGLVRFSKRVLPTIIELHDKEHFDPSASLIDLINHLRKLHFSIKTIDISNEWAELNAPQDLARFVLGTKAETLSRLSPMLLRSSIPKQMSFLVDEWDTRPTEIIAELYDYFDKKKLIVRSSSNTEDGWSHSQAGAYLSLLNISSSDKNKLTGSIDKVIFSYNDTDASNQVLVQEMVDDVVASGVVLTRSLSNGAPYYTVNYSLGSDTEAVTSGKKNVETLLLYKNSKEDIEKVEPVLSSLIPAIMELESLLKHDSLDIEFAIDQSGKIWILQVRPIAVDFGRWKVEDDHFERHIDYAKSQYRQLQKNKKLILGNKAPYGNMPDWNPAEIIGSSPSNLAFSLYRYLITDEIWALSRKQCGYRDIRPQPLLHSFIGKPYVDIRASFNSFIPEGVDSKLAERLVNYYLDKLFEQPHLHDKVEFEILLTCVTFDIETKLQSLKDSGFKKDEVNLLKAALTKVTNQSINGYREDLRTLKTLDSRYKLLTDGPANTNHLDAAYSFIEDAKEYGTLAFSNLARKAFVAISLLKSLIREGVVTEQAISVFLNSINTVATGILVDGASVNDGNLSWEEYVQRYYFLRPGTYDISMPTYGQDPERYLKPMVRPFKKNTPSETLFERKSVQDFIHMKIKDLKLETTLKDLKIFIEEAIAGREYAKFLFTRNLSHALEEIKQFGKEYGLTAEKVSNINIADLWNIRSGIVGISLEDFLNTRVQEGEEFSKLTKAVELPSLILSEDSFTCFRYPKSEPNYVTQSRIIGDIVNLTAEDLNQALQNKIVLIEHADPGYDWLFGHDISGLITMYGGANSHMTIRCAEFGIPAAIGVGEKLFNQLISIGTISLDCAKRNIEFINP